MSATDLLDGLGQHLDETGPWLAQLDAYYAGAQPLAFLAPEAREALGGRLRSLAVNLPRLVVDALVERLVVTGFRVDDDEVADAGLWSVWRRNGMPDAAAQAHVEALALGRCFVIVWAGRNRATPLVTVESARQVAVARDPATREVTAAVKRWTAGGKGHAVVFEADRITRWVTEATVVEGAVIPRYGWQQRSTIRNPLGRPPVVPMVNRGRLLDTGGVSEMDDVLDLSDALNKVMSDALVTSEFYARPRRWATGFEIVEDATGQPVNPFADAAGKVWQSESPETRFGQFDGARLDAYADMVATVTQQIGALSGLPPHYLGLHGDQPASADAIRSAEASLVARAQDRQRTFGAAWADVARLIVAVRDGTDTTGLEVDTTWASAETRTPAQAADAAAKLVTAGIIPVTQALEDLGYSPAAIDRMRTQRRQEAIDGTGIDLAQLLAGDDVA